LGGGKRKLKDEIIEPDKELPKASLFILFY